MSSLKVPKIRLLGQRVKWLNQSIEEKGAFPSLPIMKVLQGGFWWLCFFVIANHWLWSLSSLFMAEVPLHCNVLKNYLHVKMNKCCDLTLAEDLSTHASTGTATLQTSPTAHWNQNTSAVLPHWPSYQFVTCPAFSKITSGYRLATLCRQLLWNLGPISLSPSQEGNWNDRHMWKDKITTKHPQTNKQTNEWNVNIPEQLCLLQKRTWNLLVTQKSSAPQAHHSWTLG